MRIQVVDSDGGDPRAFFLGGRRLQVTRVLERAAEDSQRRLRVRVADGREFVLRQDRMTGEWRLAQVAPRQIRITYPLS
jgi:hypothetical protein